MEKRGDGSSTGSSISGIYKNMIKSPTPICMFYFSHPFGISSPSSTTPSDKDKNKKSSKYTTTTYLVTEIQKNHTDELQEAPKNTKEVFVDDRVLTPWPKSLLLPPLLQLLERKHGKKLPDIDAILEEVRGQAWHTPKLYQSHRFWSKSQIKHKVKSKVKKEENSVKMDSSNYSTINNNSGANNKLLKRRYSVPEIIMRKYSLAQQKSYEESIEVYSTTNGATANNNKCNKTSLNGQQQIQSTSPNTTISSPVKYFIPFTSSSHSDVNVSPTGSCSGGGIGEYSMRKQTLLRRMWSREWQHTKYSGSWSPPLRRSTQHSQRRLNKFHTLPEFELQSACEKCKQLGVTPRNSFDDDLIEQKEDKEQQTDMAPVLNKSPKRLRLASTKTLSSNSSSASTIINSVDPVEEVTLEDIKNDLLSTNDTDNLDNNGNNVLIYMTSSSNSGGRGCGGIPRDSITKDDSEDVLHVEIDGNNNNDKLFRNLIERDCSNEADMEEDYENGNLTLNGGTSSFNYKRLREENMSDLELDQFISQLLIENLNNVIKSVNENLQAQGEHNLVKIIDYQPTVQHLRNGQEVNDDGYNNNNKLTNQKQQHDNFIQMRNAKNGDNKNINRLNSNEPPQVNCLVGKNQYVNADVNYQELEDAEELEKRRLNLLRYGEDRSRSETSNSVYSTDAEVPTGPITALINTGSSYPGLESNGTVFVPRITAPRTESMEVQPSSSSANEDEELDGGFPDSDDDTISLVDSLDDVVTIRASKLTLLGQHQQKKAKFIFRQAHHKGQAFFVPIFNAEKMDPQILPDNLPEIPCIEMPRQLKEKLILRQRRRDIKRQNENKVKQWRMQKFIERKMGEVNLIQGYEMDDFSSGGGSFKVIALPTNKKINITIKESSGSKSKSNSSSGGGWAAKSRSTASISNTSSKNNKSKKLRNEIGMLESYKIDGRGNMQIQAPGKPEPIVNQTPVVKISKPVPKKPSIVTESKKPIVIKPKPSATESQSSIIKTKAPSKKINVSTSSASSMEAKTVMEARRKQVMKDVEQMSVYKNDLTPDPESGPMRKMWKTEIQEGDKRIEILEIVECPSQFIDVNSSDHHHNHLLPLLTSHNHKYQHLSSSAPQTTIVNKTFSVRTTGYTNGAKSARYQNTSSKIPVPVYHRSKSSNRITGIRDSRDNSPNNRYSSSTDVDSLTSAGSSTAQHQTGSKVDRMIADLLMEALKSPEDLGIDFIKSPKTKTSKRKAIHSPAILGTESSSTGYGTGDSSSRRSASNSANNKYLQRFEVIPEEKSSFSIESTNSELDGEDGDDDENEDEENQEPLTPTRDWKSQKNLDNHDIKVKRTSSFTKPPPVQKKVEKKTTSIATSTAAPTAKKKPAILVKSKSVAALVKPLVEDKKNIIKKSPSRAREAVVNDNTETKAWIGFSQQCDQSSSLEENTGDEEHKDNENSHIVHEISNRNISSSKSEDLIHDSHHRHNLISQYMSKNQTSSTTHKNHHHYHFYQYQTNNCVNLFDTSKSTSAVTTAGTSVFTPTTTNLTASDHMPCLRSNSNSLSNYDHEIQMMRQQNIKKLNEQQKQSGSRHPAPISTNSSSNDPRQRNNCCFLSSSGSENILTLIDKHNKFDNGLSAGKDSSTPRSSDHKELPYLKENIIKVEIEDANKPASDCSCSKKCLPYQVNEKNEWNVYETNDCKYIQTRYEVFETYQAPDDEDESILGTAPEKNRHFQTDDGLLHSRSKISNQIICHAINHEINHLQTPTKFKENPTPQTGCSSNCCYCDPNSKDLDCQFCVEKLPLNYVIDTPVPSTAQSHETEILNSDYRPLSTIQLDPPMMAIADTHIAIVNNKSPGKLLNRPKEINNLPRDRKSVKKEVKNEIQNHSIKIEVNNKNKTVKLPSPSKHQNQGYSSPIKQKLYNASNEDYSTISSSSASTKSTPKKVLNRRKNSKEQVKSAEKDARNNNDTCLKPDNGGLVLPATNQGWSVTVAGNYHPEMTPDVEMKLSFNKNKMDIQKKNIDLNNYLVRNQSPIQTQHKEEVYFYNNRNTEHQILPAAQINQNQYHNKPFINQRRSLSLARVDTGEIKCQLKYLINLFNSPGLTKQKSYHLPNLNVPQSRTARTTGRKSIKQVECTISKTVSHIPDKRSLSLDMGNSSRRTSFDHSQISAMNTPSEMCLSVVGSEIKKRLKPKVMTMSEKDLTRRHYSCFTRNS
ncbi:unnamed protein product [Diamesa serratosioi]